LDSLKQLVSALHPERQRMDHAGTSIIAPSVGLSILSAGVGVSCIAIASVGFSIITSVGFSIIAPSAIAGAQAFNTKTQIITE
jgi:hypothetical protein